PPIAHPDAMATTAHLPCGHTLDRDKSVIEAPKASTPQIQTNLTLVDLAPDGETEEYRECGAHVMTHSSPADADRQSFGTYILHSKNGFISGAWVLCKNHADRVKT
ncbi:MAG TPA: hypothetical protein VHW90_07395, partial [Stellaceae bacterium]|nr:hypothetical protein [Stellaceae bacterium]